MGEGLDDVGRSDWLAARRTGVGSSDAPAICGLDPWRTSLHVYLEKIEKMTPPDSEPKRWGRRLEDVVAGAYAEETGKEPRPPDKRLMRHATDPWLIASLDRVVEVGGHTRILEIKTTGRAGHEWGQSGTDEIPLGYNLQLQHQMLVTGMDWAELAVLFSGQSIGIYTVAKHGPMQVTLRGILRDFWEKVENRQAPEPSWEHPATPKLVAELYGVAGGVEVELGEEERELAEKYREIRKRISELQGDSEALKAKLTMAMGGAEVARLPGGYRVTRKRIKRKAYSVPAGEYTRFGVDTRDGPSYKWDQYA